MAEILEISEPTLDRLRARGLPGKKVGSAWEFSSRRVIDWMVKDGGKEGSSSKKQSVDLRIALAEAETKEFKVAELRGTMLHIDDVTPIVEEQFVVIKSKIAALPGRLAQKCAVETDAAVVLRLLKEEVAEVLDGISTTKLRDPDRKRHGFQPPDDGEDEIAEEVVETPEPEPEPEAPAPWDEDDL